MLKRLLVIAAALLLLAPVGAAAQQVWFPAGNVPLRTEKECVMLASENDLPDDALVLTDTRDYYVVKAYNDGGLAFTSDELKAAYTTPAGNLLTTKHELAEATFLKLRLGRCVPSRDGSVENWPPLLYTHPYPIPDSIVLTEADEFTVSATDRNRNQRVTLSWELDGPGELTGESFRSSPGDLTPSRGVTLTYDPPAALSEEQSAVVTVIATDSLGASTSAVFNITIPAEVQ